MTTTSVTHFAWTGRIEPLTTVYTPTCRQTTDDYAWMTVSSCWPRSFSSVWFWNGYYSPAICPSGYTVGCRAWTVSGWASLASLWPEMIPDSDETAALCLPSGGGFSCDPGDGYTYADHSRTASQFIYPAIEVRWRSDDLSLLETDPLTPGVVPATIGPDATTTLTIGPTSGPSPSRDDSSGSLSGGAIAGIVVGSIVALAIIGAAIALFLLKRRKKAGGGTPATQQQPAAYSGGPQMLGSAVIHEDPKGPMGGPGATAHYMPVQHPQQQQMFPGSMYTYNVPGFQQQQKGEPMPGYPVGGGAQQAYQQQPGGGHMFGSVAISETPLSASAQSPPPAYPPQGYLPIQQQQQMYYGAGGAGNQQAPNITRLENAAAMMSPQQQQYSPPQGEVQPMTGSPVPEQPQQQQQQQQPGGWSQTPVQGLIR